MRRQARYLAKLASLAGLAALACWGCLAFAHPPARDAGRAFVACPVYRDTNSGRKSGCWLATDPTDGVRYDISLGRTKPQIGRQVLVEGRLDAPDQSRLDAPDQGRLEPPDHSQQAGSACGGVVLRPVVVSVLETICPAVMLPAESYPGRRFVLDPKLVLPPADVAERLPPPPYLPRTWSIEFGFGSDFLQYQYSEVILDEIGRYIRARRPREVEVTGYAVTMTRSISGERLAEKPQLARARAEMVALALRRLGATRQELHVTWRVNPAPLVDTPGLAEPSRRRVDVSLVY